MKPSPNIGWPVNAQPIVIRKHVDGPMLRCRDGQIHWLTLWERLLLRLRLTNEQKLEAAHWQRGE